MEMRSLSPLAKNGLPISIILFIDAGLGIVMDEMWMMASILG